MWRVKLARVFRILLEDLGLLLTAERGKNYFYLTTQSGIYRIDPVIDPYQPYSKRINKPTFWNRNMAPDFADSVERTHRLPTTLTS